MSNLILISHFALSIGLFYACFCRLVHTNRDVQKSLRASLVIMGMTGLVLAGAPLIWGMQPTLWTVLLLAASLFSKFATRKAWVDGVPEAFMLPNASFSPFKIVSLKSHIQAGQFAQPTASTPSPRKEA